MLYQHPGEEELDRDEDKKQIRDPRDKTDHDTKDDDDNNDDDGDGTYTYTDWASI